MKTIRNETYSMPVADMPIVTTAKLLELTLAQAPQSEGFTFALMRARNRVADACAKAEAEIVLEDADYETARQAIQGFRWAVNHPDILKFAEQFGL